MKQFNPQIPHILTPKSKTHCIRTFADSRVYELCRQGLPGIELTAKPLSSQHEHRNQDRNPKPLHQSCIPNPQFSKSLITKPPKTPTSFMHPGLLAAGN